MMNNKLIPRWQSGNKVLTESNVQDQGNRYSEKELRNNAAQLAAQLAFDYNNTGNKELLKELEDNIGVIPARKVVKNFKRLNPKSLDDQLDWGEGHFNETPKEYMLRHLPDRNGLVWTKYRDKLKNNVILSENNSTSQNDAVPQPKKSPVPRTTSKKSNNPPIVSAPQVEPSPKKTPVFNLSEEEMQAIRGLYQDDLPIDTPMRGNVFTQTLDHKGPNGEIWVHSPTGNKLLHQFSGKGASTLKNGGKLKKIYI